MINFYSSKTPYFEFSNFYPAKIFVDGKTWNTSEHYYQAMKFDDSDLQEYVRSSDTPKIAANRGRNKEYPLRKDWDLVKEDYMWKALIAKFTQHSNLKNILLNTGDELLVEHTTNDSYWGDGGGNGKNRLGMLLVELRTQIKEGKIC